MGAEAPFWHYFWEKELSLRFSMELNLLKSQEMVQRHASSCTGQKLK